jgi:hypothetical protein
MTNGPFKKNQNTLNNKLFGLFLEGQNGKILWICILFFSHLLDLLARSFTSAMLHVESILKKLQKISRHDVFSRRKNLNHIEIDSM